ncbi:MAG: HisA/HisF-related TIM barrel protein [Thaumarchaeota archaeon]|nr:HisA/HisF-related TIM barrel protein [Nitrososphaerota archaeon]
MLLISVDIMNGKVVRLLHGNPDSQKIYSDNPLSVAEYWAGMGYGLHIVDLDAAMGRGNNRDLIDKILKVDGFKEVSGGVRDAEQATNLLAKGASRVVIGTMAFTDCRFHFSLKGLPVAISIDVRGENVSIYGWQSTTSINFLHAMDELAGMGFDKFEITFVDMDGTRLGLNTGQAGLVPEGLRKNIILSGGLRLEDAETVYKMGFAGCIVGSDAYERMFKSVIR